jgi:hypothetical protein
MRFITSLRGLTSVEWLGINLEKIKAANDLGKRFSVHMLS